MEKEHDMRLSSEIRDAQARHRAAYPDGDWRAVNDELSELFHRAAAILGPAGVDPWKGGNEGRAKALERLGH